MLNVSSSSLSYVPHSKECCVTEATTSTSPPAEDEVEASFDTLRISVVGVLGKGASGTGRVLGRGDSYKGVSGKGGVFY